jgi:hypothetical protein
MRLPNRDGDGVDPMPVLVVASLALAVTASFGPLYFMALGLSLRPSLAASAVLFVAGTGVAYWRLVWTYRPDHREVVPPGDRFRRLLYLGVLLALAIVALGLPFL